MYVSTMPGPRQATANPRLTFSPRKIIRSTSACAVLVLPALAATVTAVSSRSLVTGKPLSAPASSRRPFQSCRLYLLFCFHVHSGQSSGWGEGSECVSI